MRALRRLLPFILVIALALAATLVIVGTTPATATATVTPYPAGITGGTFDSDRRLSNPDLSSCDVARPAQQFITFPSYAQTPAQICGIWALENAASSAYAQLHDYRDGFDAGGSTDALYVEAGYVQNFLQSIAYDMSIGAADDLTPDQRAAYDWYLAVQQTYETAVAVDAQQEYQEWERLLCDYRPPSTHIFTYNPTYQPLCNPDGKPGLAGLFTTLAPPTYANFVEYGRYDAEQELGLTQQASERADQTLIDNSIIAGTGTLGAILAGSAPQLAVQLGLGSSALKSMLQAIAPENQAIFDTLRPEGEAIFENLEEVNALQEVAELEALGEEIPAELETIASTIAEEVAEEAGVAAEVIGEAAEVGADFLSGPLLIGTIAVTIAVMQGVSVFTAANIPHQLADDINAADPANTDGFVTGMVTAHDGAKAAMVYANYRAQLQFPSPKIGVETSSDCPDCVVYDSVPVSSDNVPAQLHVTALNADGTPTGWSTTLSEMTSIDSWGLGAANGAYGVPHVSVSVAGGKVWTKREASSAPTDESEAGLSGWLPSGQLRYYNAAGQPMIAYLQGDQFVTHTSPGSVDAGGYDAGDDCATPGECTTASSIVVMGSGGTPQLRDEITQGSFAGIPCTANDPGTHDCFTDTLKVNGKLVPANGSTVPTSDGDTIKQTGTSHLYRLTLIPDAGTAAAIWVGNSYNTSANNKTNGVAPNGGLVAGDTATFTDPENSVAGYDTTYTWQVQTVCPVDPGHPAQTIQGVTVCSDSPDYDQPKLGADEQDLTSCVATVGTCSPGSNFGVTWTADPAFHGGPVTTLTGRSVDWTWPAPGTYHLRLITKDQYGVTKTRDQDLVVSAASAPRSTLSYASAEDPQPRSISLSVISPLQNGNALTVTGCVLSPATIGSTAYASPVVSVDWGDGSAVDTGTAGDSSGVTVTHQPSSDCTTSWQWTATHTYAVPTLGWPLAQVPITVSTRDVTFPVTKSADLPGGTKASSTVTLYADIYAPTAPPSFVAGAATRDEVTAGEFTTVSGYVTSLPAATIAQADATGVRHDGATCTAGLPSGMGFQAFDDNRFVITGTPRVDDGGCYAITVTATNPHGSTDERVIVDVTQAPRITSPASAGWATSDAHDSVTVTTTGFPTPKIKLTEVDCTTGCGSALPTDVTFVDNGDGTATLSADGLSDDDTGVYELTLTAASSRGTVTQTFTLTIEGLPVFTSADSTGFTTGRAGTFPVGISSTTTATVTCSVPGSNDQCRTGDGSRPDIDPDLAAGTGLSLVGSTTDGAVTISGIPAATGSFPVTLTATNAAGSTTQTLTILVSATGGATITMVEGDNLVNYTAHPEPPSGTATFMLGQAGSVTLCSNLPGDTLTTQTVSNGETVPTPLPAGLTITAVTNTACPAGAQQFTLGGTPSTPLTAGSTGSTAYRIADEAGGVALLTLRLLGAPTFSSPSTATFTLGQAGSFTASLGTLSDTSGTDDGGCITTAGALPAGLELAAHPNGTATIAGTPTASGRTTITLTGTHCGSQSTTQQLTIDVVKAPVITSEGSAGFQMGAGGSFTVTTGEASYPTPALRATGLPVGATFTDNGDGSGTLEVAPDMPATDSPITLTVEATSTSGSDTQQLRLAVGATPAITSPAADATVVMPRGSAASYTVESSGAPTATMRCSIGGTPCSDDNLPAGLAFTDNGDGTATLGGTPTALGRTAVTVTAGNDIGSAAATALDVLVYDAAAFAGTTTGSSCDSASAGSKHHVFVATDSDTWTVCGTGSPTPAITLQSVTCGGSTTNLPSGLTFTDDENGSATIAGRAAIGSGAACPGGYTISVAFANAGGTVVQDLTLDVNEVIEWTTPTTTGPFVPGAPNAAVLGAAGSPAPAFALDPASSLPAWLTITDQGNGTASLSGTPPASAAGTSVTFTVDVTNDDAAPLVEQITVPVSAIVLTAANPPTAHLGVAYHYLFEAQPGATFGLADGSALPDGLTLSASGRLSGTPTELGRFPVALALTSGGTTVTTGTINLKVGVGEHALEISQFRTIAPGDWFVQVVNTTGATIPLAGWHVGLQQPGATSPELVPLGAGLLAPGATAVVTTPASSLRSQLAVTAFGAPVVAFESGFEVVAPNGAVVDAAGVAGALPDLVEGTGVDYPSPLTEAHLRSAFVRDGFADGQPVDTDDNAADFTFATVVGVVDTPTVQVSFDVDAPVFGQPVTATATVTSPSGTPEGTVQFAVEGTDVGTPVAVGTDGTAASRPLDDLSVGDHDVSATFTPTDDVAYAAVSAHGTIVIGQAATTTRVVATASALTATVTPVAPGAGQPSGTVKFLIDGIEVGTAELDHGVATFAHPVPAGVAHAAGASYEGSEGFTASSGSTARHDPTITARVTSAKPRSSAGWYRTPVTVTFSCTTTAATLVAACPAPVTLSHDGAAQAVSRTITATDGGVATSTVTPVNIDRTAPKVRIRGVRRGTTHHGRAPKATCIGRDALSGIASCKVTRTRHGQRVTYTAVATDKAGNTTRTRVKVSLAAYSFTGVPYRHGAYIVRGGHTGRLTVVAKVRPHYLGAVPYPHRPSVRDRWLHRAGTVGGVRRWSTRVAFTRAQATINHGYWNVGVLTGHTLHVIRVRVR